MPTQKQRRTLDELIGDREPRVSLALFLMIADEQRKLHDTLLDAYFGVVPEEKLFITYTQEKLVAHFHYLLEWGDIDRGLGWLQRNEIMRVHPGDIFGDNDEILDSIVTMRVCTWAIKQVYRTPYSVTQEPSGEPSNYEITYAGAGVTLSTPPTDAQDKAYRRLAKRQNRGVKAGGTT